MTAKPRPRTLIILSQVFIPDPASLGQYLADVAKEMSDRGWRVVVYTARSGYDDPTHKYPRYQKIHGIEIHRLPFCSFGKSSIKLRILGTLSFMIQSFIAAMFTPHMKGIFFSTSPPMIGAVAATVGIFRRVSVAYWAMDLNPDQLIALGKLTPGSPPAVFLECVNRFILHRSALIIALDRFMADRLRPRARIKHKLLVVPPWSHENFIEPVDQATNPFRVAHNLVGKFVIMYSGNHSPSNPLATLLEATLAFKNEDQIRFLFVGGGIGKKDVEDFIQLHNLATVISLPYQPKSNLRFSLSAADVHVVSLGPQMVGIVHPSKVYGAMAAARPLLYLGPRPSHICDFLDQNRIGWAVAHGDVAIAVDAINEARTAPPALLRQMGATAQSVLRESLTQELLCARLCDALEQALAEP